MGDSTAAGIMQLAEQALAAVATISCEQALARKDDGDLIFVDVRDIREVEKSDTIEGSHHAPRGMIEFWFDPQSPYYRDIYGDQAKTYVLFCNGNPRSALSAKALKDIGIDNVAQLSGGMPAWRDAGGPTEKKKRR
ncbi:MAG: rhodanese-like domain-containing protein [Pseudomonadota bacterium]